MRNQFNCWIGPKRYRPPYWITITLQEFASRGNLSRLYVEVGVEVGSGRMLLRRWARHFVSHSFPMEDPPGLDARHTKMRLRLHGLVPFFEATQ